MHWKYSILSGFLAFCFQLGCAQQQEVEKVTQLLEAAEKAFLDKSKGVEFTITSRHRFACSDSIIQEQKMVYMVRNNEYFIGSAASDFVMTRDFFIRINHQDKKVIYAPKPLLDYQERLDGGYLKSVRRLLAQSSLVKIDTLEDQYRINVEMKEGAPTEYRAITINCSKEHRITSLYFELRLEDETTFFRKPDCLTIEYSDEQMIRPGKQPFLRSKYITKNKQGHTLTAKYADYELIEQVEPDE